MYIVYMYILIMNFCFIHVPYSIMFQYIKISKFCLVPSIVLSMFESSYCSITFSIFLYLSTCVFVPWYSLNSCSVWVSWVDIDYCPIWPADLAPVPPGNPFQKGMDFRPSISRSIQCYIGAKFQIWVVPLFFASGSATTFSFWPLMNPHPANNSV